MSTGRRCPGWGATSSMRSACCPRRPRNSGHRRCSPRFRPHLRDSSVLSGWYRAAAAGTPGTAGSHGLRTRRRARSGGHRLRLVLNPDRCRLRGSRTGKTSNILLYLKSYRQLVFWSCLPSLSQGLSASCGSNGCLVKWAVCPFFVCGAGVALVHRR